MCNKQQCNFLLNRRGTLDCDETRTALNFFSGEVQHSSQYKNCFPVLVKTIDLLGKNREQALRALSGRVRCSTFFPKHQSALRKLGNWFWFHQHIVLHLKVFVQWSLYVMISNFQKDCLNFQKYCFFYMRSTFYIDPQYFSSTFTVHVGFEF